MSINAYIDDDQDPKIVEKTITKIRDMLIQGEVISYIAVQKKPGVSLLADSIVLTNHRIFICSPAKLGFSTDFKPMDWKDIKTVSFKEALFGAKFTVIPLRGEQINLSYIPKVQARKLYKFSKEAMESYTKALGSQRHDSNKRDQQAQNRSLDEIPESEHALTEKLTKLKSLFDMELITLQEYEQKKEELLRQL